MNSSATREAYTLRTSMVGVLCNLAMVMMWELHKSTASGGQPSDLSFIMSNLVKTALGSAAKSRLREG